VSTSHYDTAFHLVKGLTWLPWVGKRFSERPDQRLLVVGESHYYDEDKQTQNREAYLNDRESTREMILDCHAEETTRTLCNLPQLLFKTNEIDRSAFWGDTAYFNLVQRPMDHNRKPPERPSGDDFVAGWRVFADVVRILQPSHCLLIGVSSAMTFDVSMASQNLSYTKVFRATHVAGVRPGHATLRITGKASKLIFVHHLSRCKRLTQWHDYLQAQHGDLMSTLNPAETA
jgi:hypothetical protein